MGKLQRISQIIGLFLGHGYLAVLASGHIYKGPFKGFCLPFLSCYACPMAIFSCPIGSLQHFMAIRTVPFLLFGFLGLVGLTLGRMSCGWLCPFGFLQDMLYSIPGLKIEIPRALYNLKFLSLALLVFIIPFLTGAPWFSKLCPFGTLTAGIPWVLASVRTAETAQPAIALGELGPLFVVKLVILAGFLVLFVKASRPFCQTTCPLGALLQCPVVRRHVRWDG